MGIYYKLHGYIALVDWTNEIKAKQNACQETKK